MRLLLDRTLSNVRERYCCLQKSESTYYEISLFFTHFQWHKNYDTTIMNSRSAARGYRIGWSYLGPWGIPTSS